MQGSSASTFTNAVPVRAIRQVVGNTPKTPGDLHPTRNPAGDCRKSGGSSGAVQPDGRRDTNFVNQTRRAADGTALAALGLVLDREDPARVSSAPSHPGPFSMDSIVVGESPRMRAVFEFVRVIADSQSNVLVLGETGTGKEMIARLIHHTSRRRHRPFIAVSCAILAESLIESELFGHERGAFTGAIKDRRGRFEAADGGTIFLDDIDDVPPGVQVKLLRVLQTRTVERVGGTRTIPIDVRVITGSKRRLRQLVREGKFREDLFYRLHVVPISLPPLRERREDIPVLTDHFIHRFFHRRGEPVPALSSTVREAFQRYSWPGNVRELENACERIAQTCTCDTVRVGCMPATLVFEKRAGGAAPQAVAGPTQPGVISLDDRLREVETHLIVAALEHNGGNKSKAAEQLRIKRSTLGDRIRKLGLEFRCDDYARPDSG
jgi:transcriptional regulator with GAF, ATPase, and Fis domain